MFLHQPVGPHGPGVHSPPCPGSMTTWVVPTGVPSLTIASFPHGVVTRYPVGDSSNTDTTTPVGVTRPRAISGTVGGGSVVDVMEVVVARRVVVVVVVVDVEVVTGIVVVSAPASPEQAPTRTTRTRSRDRIPAQVKPDTRPSR